MENNNEIEQKIKDFLKDQKLLQFVDNSDCKKKEESFKRALKDATIMYAFELKKENKGDKKKKGDLNQFEEAKEVLFKANPASFKDITDLINEVFGCFTDYNEKFENKLTQQFTYGNSQKLVNMYYKYLYCLDENRFDENKSFINYNCCHCPIDSYIAKSIIVLCNKNFDKFKLDGILDANMFEKNGTLDIIKCIALSEKIVWSQLDCGTYETVQNFITDLSKKLNLCSNLMFDIMFWEKPDLAINFISEYKELEQKVQPKK